MRSVLLVLTLGLAVGCGGRSNALSGPVATDFTLESVDGDTVRLSTYTRAEKVVLLNFWATWCAPCAGEMPHLQRLHEKYQAQGLVILGIAMDGAETVGQVGEFVDKHRLGYPVLLDTNNQVVNTYNPTLAAPHNVLIGRNGVIAWQKEGYLPGDEVGLEQQIQKLLSKPTTPEPTLDQER